MTLFVASIVEGETEERCVKALLSGIWRDLLHAADLEPLAVLEPIPAHRSSLVKEGHPELGRMVERAVRGLQARLRHSAADRGFVLLLIDADEDCPARLGPQLLGRARAARNDADIVCVLAKRELENWFKAAATSLAGVIGLPGDLTVPANPEAGSGDTWLTRQMQRKDRTRKYTKPADAIELAQRMDYQQCRDNAPSFDKLCRELEARLPQPPDEQGPTDEAAPPPEGGASS
ncbi:MAG: DUF4276 family protein [Gemmataceae bacterium]